MLGLCSIAGFSLAEASGGYSIVAVLRILIAVASLIGSRHVGFRSCSALGSRVQTQSLWNTGLLAPRHVASSWTRDQTYVSFIGRCILNHGATREALKSHHLTGEMCLKE